MKKFVFLFTVFAITVQTLGDTSCKCDVPPRFFEEINCKPIYEKPGDCCPKKYDCSGFDGRPKDKCHLLGQFYGIGEPIPNDIVYQNCHVGCVCLDKRSSSPQITCAILDCPEWLGQKPKPGCHWRYEVDKCCKVGQNCPPFDKLATCQVDGTTYYEGQRFEPSADKTVSCVCDKGFSGKFESPFCIKNRCMSEVRGSGEIDKYCAPVFFKTSKKSEPACPYEFVCPKSSDNIVRAVAKSSSDKCKFGSKTLNVGDKFQRVNVISTFEKQETNCECKIPPFVTCVKNLVYDFAKMPDHIKQHFNQEDY